MRASERASRGLLLLREDGWSLRPMAERRSTDTAKGEPTRMRRQSSKRRDVRGEAEK